MSIQILPGTHVDVVAGDRAAELAVTGVVAMPLEMDWGDLITEIYSGDSTFTRLGYNLSDVKLKCVNEVMNYADELILYRSNMTGGVKASGTLATGITATAKYVGTRGNDISVVITASGSNWTIQTLLGTKEVDSQTVSDIADFAANDFISISGTGTLAAATVKLTGGTNGSIQTDTADDFMAQMEKYEFNVIAYPGSGTTTRQKIVDFVNTERKKNVMIQAVISGLAADDEAIYNNTIGGVTENYTLTAAEATATVAGVIAKQGITGSLTHYDSLTGWTDVSDNLTYEQQETLVQAGQLLIVMLYGTPAILYDINSLTTYTSTKPKDFRKGLIVRTLDSYAVSLQKLLDKKTIGKIRNSVNGRSQIKTMISDMTVTNYLNKGYVEGFTADDITVSKADTDAVTATVAIQPVDTVDKIQVTVTSVA